MEWKTGEEGRAHAQAFADELAALMNKYGAEFTARLESSGYDSYSVDVSFDFNCCSESVDPGAYTDGTDLKVKSYGY